MIRPHRGDRTEEFLGAIEMNDLDRLLPEQDLTRILDHLSARSRRMVRIRYGIGTGISWTLREIGQEFGITGQRARQIISKSLRTLRDKCDPDSFLNLGLSGRAIASLGRMGIRTIKDLSQRKDSDLLTLPGFGMKSLEIVIRTLDRRESSSLDFKNLEMIEADLNWDVFMIPGFSHPVHQCLRSLGIEKISDLISKTETEFLSHRSGKRCLMEIKIFLGIEKLPFWGKLNVKKKLFPRPYYLPINLESVASRLKLPLRNLINGIKNGAFKGLPVWKVGKGWKGLRCDPEELEEWISTRKAEGQA